MTERKDGAATAAPPAQGVPEEAQALGPTRDSRGLSSHWQQLPAWIQAIAALVTVLLSGFALWLGVGATSTTPLPTSTVRVADATVSRVALVDDGFSVIGDFRSLRPDHETLVVIAHVAGDAQASWLPMSPTLMARETAEGGYQDGEWSADFDDLDMSRQYVVQPVILPGVVPQGAVGDGLDELRRLGPAAPGVILAGPEVMVK